MNNILDNKWSEFEKELLKSDFTNDERKKIKEAWEFIKIKHDGQLRKSGEPYAIHPLATATYILKWKMDSDTVICALLHDVVEDTNTTIEEIKNKFGDDIAKIVDFVTKISKFSEQNRSNQEHEKKQDYVINILLSITDDIRAFTTKIADRLHNMKTIKFLPEEKQIRIAKETFNIYANIAGRIGMYNIKTELLDLSFKILFPNIASDINKKINLFAHKYAKEWREFNEMLHEVLKKSGLPFRISSRLKGLYSTCIKSCMGKIDLSEIKDFFASRVIINADTLECYRILGLINLNFSYVPQSLKDYISSPKFNLYQSLHVLVVYKGIYVEIQIRTKYMDDVANNGLASHWIYKENKNNHVISEIMSDIINNQKTIENINISKLAKNKVIDILVINDNKWYIYNENESLLDLAYKVNKDDFLKISSISINENKVSLWYKPTTSQIIRFNYSNKIRANENWLKICKNNDAINCIKEYLKSSNIDHNKFKNEYLNKCKNKLGNKIVEEETLIERLQTINIQSFEAFYEKIKKIENIWDTEYIYNIASRNKWKWKDAINILKNKINHVPKNNIYFLGLENINYKKIIYPSCCSKVPGIDCVAVFNKKILEIHKFNCLNILKERKKYILKWDNSKLVKNPRLFNCTIKFENNKNDTTKILFTILKFGVEILNLNTSKKPNTILETEIEIGCYSIMIIEKIIDEIESKYEIYNVKIK